MNPGPSGLNLEASGVYAGPSNINSRLNVSANPGPSNINFTLSYGYHGPNEYCVNPEPSCLNLGPIYSRPPNINRNLTYGYHGPNAYCVNPEPSCLDLKPSRKNSRPLNVSSGLLLSCHEYEFCVSSDPSSKNPSLLMLQNHPKTHRSCADSRIINLPLVSGKCFLFFIQAVFVLPLNYIDCLIKIC